MKPILLLVGALCIFFSSCKRELTLKDGGALVPKTVEQDASLPSIAVNGTHLHSEAFGNPADPMVVFLHGGPGTDYRNAYNLKSLVSNRYYVVFYDQRGSGLSKRHPKNSFTLQQMLDDLSAVIQHYRNAPSQKVFLFGHSWGAMLATAYAGKYPATINGLVLAEPGGFNEAELQAYANKSRKPKLFNEASNDALYADQFLSGDENDHEVLDYKLALVTAYTYATNNEEGIEGASPFWRYGAAVIKKLSEIGKNEGFDFRQGLGKFTTKVLFLYSQNNHAYGQAFAQKLASAFPAVQLAQVAGTGHEMIYFGWEKVKALALPYLDTLR